jgi:uncharacterized protein involved in exopolysaccharide biosynthesis
VNLHASRKSENTDAPVFQVDFAYLGGLFIGKFHVLLIAGLISMVLGYAVSFLITPSYRAEIVLIPSSPFGPSGSPLGAGVLGDLASLAMPDDEATRLAHALEVLNSRNFALAFMTDEAILHELFSSRWDEEVGSWRERGMIRRLRLRLEGIDASALDNGPDPWEIQERFSDMVFVKSDPSTKVYVLSVTAADASRVAEWANTIVSQLNDHVRVLAVEEAEAMVRHLKEELSNTNLAETREALSSALERQFERAALAKSQRDYVFRVIDPAITPEIPSSPKRLVMAAISFLLGGLLALVYLVLRDVNRSD